MKRIMPVLLVALFACALVVGWTLIGHSQETQKQTQKQQTPQDQQSQGQPQMSQEEMAAWQKAATPGPNHAAMAKYVGKWNGTAKMWMKPGTEPMTMTITAECDTVYGGRYLVEKNEGMMMGMPFEGTAIIGYDNLEQKPTLVWYDNMSTGILFSMGTCSEQCKTQTYTYTQKDPMTGKDQKGKMVSRAVDDNKWILEGYMIDQAGKENKTMEITYTRG